jgi:outer membrane protein TolC
VRRSPDQIVAVQEVVRAEGLARQALAAALTTVNAQGVVERALIPPQPAFPGADPISTTYSASVSATQPIFAPRAWYGIGTARLGVDSAKQTVEDRRRTVLTAVANNVVAVVTAERISELNRIGLRSALERLELTRRRARLGIGTRLDVVRAEQDVAVARATLVTGDESLRKTREALGMSLGTPDAYGVPPTISLDAMEADLRSTCTASAPDQRADVQAARTQVTIAERNVTDARLAFSPTVDLQSRLSMSAPRQFDAQQLVRWSISAVLSIPLWEGGARYGVTRANQASLEQQRARLDAAQRSATLDTNQAHRAISVAEQSRAVSEQARDLARETARLTQIAFESGTATSFDLVDSGRRQREADLDLTLKEFDVVRARISALLASASCR